MAFSELNSSFSRLSPNRIPGKGILFVVLLLVIMTPLLSAQDCIGIPDQECQLLWVLYYATGGPNWTAYVNWKPDIPVSWWYGITTEPDDGGHVVGINLCAYGLIGEFPYYLAELPRLRKLDLSLNELTGEIPPVLNKLAGLTELDFSGNNFTGTIPVEIGALTRLKYLNLASNDFTGTIPSEFGNLINLTDLFLGGNNLVGEIPPELGNLTKLEDLELSANNLSGPLPPELGNLSNLKRLWLGGNSLEGEIPSSMQNLTNLFELYLVANRLSGELPAFLAYYPSSVDLRYNCLHTSDQSLLAMMEYLHYGEFLSTQTLPPNNIVAETVATDGKLENSVKVSWDPIEYNEDDGGYLVYYRETGAGTGADSELTTGGNIVPAAESSTAYHYYGMTADKKASSMVISNLKTGNEYEFRVDTLTWATGFNPNDLQSPPPPEKEQPTAVSGSYSRAFIPNWKKASDYWTGIVDLNFGTSAFNLNLKAYDSNGILDSLAHNPASTPIGAGLQKSLLGSEFFGSSGQEGLSWIEMGADGTNKMGSIFLFGVSDTQMMDGAEAQSSYAQKLYFTRPLDEGFFAGWDPEFQISVINPTDEAATVRCILRGSNGEAEQTHVIPSKGFIAGDTEVLIGVNHGIVNGYMEVEVTEGNGVIGFSRIEFPGVRTALGMNAMQTTASKRFYSAQLAHGMNILTNLRLVNTSSSTRSVTLSAIGDDGTPVADPVTVEIHSRQIYSADLGTLFGLEGEGVITTGSLVVDADGNGIIGDIIFAEGDTLEYAMSLPLQDRLFEEAVFNHISNLPTVFTGFAFYNPGDGTANVLIEAIGTDGQKVAEKTLILNPGERIARTLTDVDMWPSFPTQSGGYIKIQSSQPIAGQQLFGDRSLRYMAAIPPTIRLEEMFE